MEEKEKVGREADKRSEEDSRGRSREEDYRKRKKEWVGVWVFILRLINLQSLHCKIS
jgi:hypothetical protein